MISRIVEIPRFEAIFFSRTSDGIETSDGITITDNHYQD